MCFEHEYMIIMIMQIHCICIVHCICMIVCLSLLFMLLLPIVIYYFLLLQQVVTHHGEFQTLGKGWGFEAPEEATMAGLPFQQHLKERSVQKLLCRGEAPDLVL